MGLDVLQYNFVLYCPRPGGDSFVLSGVDVSLVSPKA